jgi:excisionase family DNA binding protein
MTPNERGGYSVTPAEVAALARVQPRTVRRWHAEGWLDSIRVGRRVLIHEDSPLPVFHPTSARGENPVSNRIRSN